MATLIRSARLTSEPRLLPLHADMESVAPVKESPTPSPETVMPLEPANLIETAAAEPASQMQPMPYPESFPIPDTPPALDPETEARLMEEARIAREEAMAQGREEGYAQGLTEAQRTLESEIHAIKNLLESATTALESQITGLEDVIVSLAFEAVCKIIGSSLHDHDGVVAVVRETLSHVKESEPISIRVSPSDYSILSQAHTQLAKGHLGSKITLVPDDRVVLGGCLIETSGGNLDGRLETQMQQFRDALLSAKRQRPDWKDTTHAL